jgi:hypothetical protein
MFQNYKILLHPSLLYVMNPAPIHIVVGAYKTNKQVSNSVTHLHSKYGLLNFQCFIKFIAGCIKEYLKFVCISEYYIY